MIKRKELTTYINELLGCDAYQDYAPNGLQVEGHAEIERICTAVTASEEAIMQAVAKKADALLVHHGFFWRGEQPMIVGVKKRRIASLITSNMNLYGYHLPLDCHPTLGNNAQLAKLLNIKSTKSHQAGKTPGLLWSGELQKPMVVSELANLITEKLHRTPLVIQASDQPVQRIAWCSGAAQDFIEDAHKLGVDIYLSGEISERTYYQARELELNYLACGHHASERYGIQALGEHLSQSFDLHHEFIDSNNPV